MSYVTQAQRRAEQSDAAAKIKDSPDEFHPDARRAAAFADLKASDAALAWLDAELRRALERSAADRRQAARIAELKAWRAEALAARVEIEERVGELVG